MDSLGNTNRLISNFLSLSIVKGFQFLIPLIILPYLLKTIGVEKFGQIAFVLSIAVYFGSIIQYGFSVTATREISRCRGDKERVGQIYSRVMSASLILAITSMAVFTVIASVLLDDSIPRVLYIGAISFIIFQSLLPLWFFQGMERMKNIAIVNLMSSFLYLGLLISFVQDEADFVLVPILNCIAVLIAYIICILIIRFSFGITFSLPTIRNIMDVYVKGWPSFLSQFAPNLYNNTSLFFVGMTESSTIVGLYSTVVRVVDAVCSIGYILSSTFLPYIAQDISRHRLLEYLMLPAGVVLSSLLVLFNVPISNFLVGDDHDISLYLSVMSLSVVMLFIVITYGTNYLMLTGLDGYVGKVSVIVSVLAFILAVLIIPIMGIWGAIITLIVARFIMAIPIYLQYRISSKENSY